MTKLGASLPRGEANGLGALARALIDSPDAVHVVVALVDCKKITTDTDTGDPADLTLRGRLRANATPRHPGVIMEVATDGDVLVFATDVCERWTHNVRSIALGLEALRAVDRYGIGQTRQQYRGFAKAISSGAPTETPVQVLARLSRIDVQPGDPARVMREAYREAVRRTHPDRPAGDPASFRELMAAVQELGLRS